METTEMAAFAQRSANEPAQLIQIEPPHLTLSARDFAALTAAAGAFAPNAALEKALLVAASLKRS